MDSILASLQRDVQTIRAQSPLVLNLTNFVAMDLNANALLALGASPIMAHATEELSELVQISGAVVINIGTLDAQFIESARVTLEAARKWNKPVVLDPVGAGASQLRTNAAREFFAHPAVRVVRANASEMAALLNLQEATTKGVDSTLSSSDIQNLIQNKAHEKDVVLAVSGATDFIFYRNQMERITGGCAMMTQVTAMGCSATAIVGAFCAINPNFFAATTHAMMTMKKAGEAAKKQAHGPGHFRAHFLDALSHEI